ncbi:RidA family protein, partial [Streptomyces caniscabiei]|uniref:RidA family protein n=1 Tax=Streptomyces caniscabiei TaxID=2746961 RepID=UPI003B97EB0F
MVHVGEVDADHHHVVPGRAALFQDRPDVGEGLEGLCAQVRAILEEGGATWDDVMMIRVYLTDVDHFAEMNAIYNEYFEKHLTTAPAARTTVYVVLPPGLLI